MARNVSPDPTIATILAVILGERPAMPKLHPMPPSQPRRIANLRPDLKVKGKKGIIDLYRIGSLAVFLGKDVMELRAWESNEFIPRTPYVQGTTLLYTIDMMEVVKRIVSKTPPSPATCVLIYDAWRQLGVPLHARDIDEALRKTAA